MLPERLASLVRFAISVQRGTHTTLPPSMRSDVARAMLTLGRTRTLPNPIALMGFKVSYFEPKQLRHLFRELFEKGTYLFHTDSSQPLILDCGSNIGMSILFF